MFTATTVTKTGKDNKSTFEVLVIKWRGIVIQEIFVNDQMKLAMQDIDAVFKSFEKGGTK